MYYDPFLAAAAANADPNYRLQVRILNDNRLQSNHSNFEFVFQAAAAAAAQQQPLMKTTPTPMSTAYTAAASYNAAAARAAYGAATAQPTMSGYAAVAG